ncbi:MAG: hypothetical protein HW393_591 [Dehalococcoidia bacterium]|nr:hypothetical protein [Dehalococcoidia bacterium]
MTPQQTIGCVAVALVAVACGGGSTPATTPPALTANSPLRGGPGGGFELCDGPICATNDGAFSLWDEAGMKVLWRGEEARADEVLTVSGRSADGRDTLSEEDFGRATSPDDLPGYHYFPSGLKFPTPGIWVLELDTGKAVGTVVVKVGE